MGRSPILTAVLGAIAVGGLIVAISGHNPLSAYVEIVRGAFAGPSWQDTLSWAIPLTGMALVAALPLRGGMVNLGGDGQLVLGGLSAVVIGLYAPGPGPVRVALAVAGAMAAGALWAGLAGLGEAWVGVPLLISTLLLNYPARGFASWLVRFPLRDEASGLPQSDRLGGDARLPRLWSGSAVSSGLVLVAAVAVAAIVIDRRSVAGYELRMRGLNARFAAYGGVKLSRQAVFTLLASGAVAGLVGAVIVLGQEYRYTDGSLLALGYTYTGLMSALLARGDPRGAIAGALFFAMLQNGGFGMERATEVPRELTAIIQAVIILFLAARTGLVRRQGAPA